MSATTEKVSRNMMNMTDDTGRIVCYDITEPPPASIVMTNGNYGNAWQRHGNDGLWHSTTGGKRRWSQLLRMRNLVLVYEAPEREVEAECEHGVKGCDARAGHYHVEVQR